MQNLFNVQWFRGYFKGKIVVIFYNLKLIFDYISNFLRQEIFLYLFVYLDVDGYFFVLRRLEDNFIEFVFIFYKVGLGIKIYRFDSKCLFVDFVGLNLVSLLYFVSRLINYILMRLNILIKYISLVRGRDRI